MVTLAHLGDILAFIGFVIGLLRWAKLETSSQWLTAFMGVSAACGLGQTLLFHFGFQTAWPGNLWDLAVLALLIPACLFRMRRSLVQTIRPLLVLAQGAWLFFNLAMGDLAQFDNYLSLAFYGLLGLVGAAMLSQFIDDSLNLFQKPGFIMGLVALSAGLTDALLSLALSHYGSLSKHFVMGLMVYRNTVWCAAYAALSYSLFLKGSKHEPKSKRHASVQPTPRGSQSYRRGHLDTGGDRVGWQS